MTDTLYGEYQEQMEMTAALLGENRQLNEMTWMTAALVWEKLGPGVVVFSFKRRQRRRCELLQASSSLNLKNRSSRFPSSYILISHRSFWEFANLEMLSAIVACASGCDRVLLFFLL